MKQEMSFGAYVRQLRREMDLTQEELARRVGCAAITLRKIEADDLRASVQIAERLAMALAIPLEERAEFVRWARSVKPVSSDLPQVTPPPSMEEIGREDLTGRAIRGYALAERIGMGGMGSVYRAVQPNVEREVAVKIILPAYANHPDFIRRFEAEAQLVARLEHPHIVPLYDYWREPGVAYLVMRLLRGGNVENLLGQGPIPIELTAKILEQVCSALHSAHRIGIIHRDLKPANVLLDEDSNAYLADFGIAKNLGNPDFENQTAVDVLIGSPQYMSPEQIQSLSIRPQTDIYCLGIMLYEMLTGTVPFNGPTPFEMIQQHISTPMPPLSARRAGLPAALDTVIMRATAKTPEDRYSDAMAFLNDFRQSIGRMTDSLPTVIAYEEEISNTEINNPFKGLRAFNESDADNFFGRETLVQQLLARLGEGGELSRFLAVVGPSGSGKSSVVRAGLVPALRRGGLPGSENWFIVDMIPGKHPFEELETSLLRVAVNPPDSLLSQLKDGNRGLLRAVHRILPADETVELVLVIDQFEEIFTLVEDEEERSLLLESIANAIMDERSRLRVVITLRADFTDRPLRYVDFGEMMNRRFEFVLPLTADEVERAVAGPAQRVGLKLEKGLVSTIIREAGNQPGTLPLLQYALSELFEKRNGRTLTNKAYREIGGVLGALGRSAEAIYKNLNVTEQSAARQLFLRLVTLGEGTEDTRRRVLQSELEALNMISSIIDRFSKARLLTFDHDPITRGPTVEVAHEALIREWTRLREWLMESRADIRSQRQLAHAAQEWELAQRDPSFLLSGTRLEQFEGWAGNTSLALTQNEQSFLNASITERDQKADEELSRQQRELETAQKLAETEKRSADQLRQRAVFLRIALGVAVIAAIFAVVAQSIAVRERNIAQQQALITSVRELAGEANANLDVDPERSILLALQAVNKTYTLDGTALPEAQEALHNAVQASRIQLTLRGHTDAVWYATFSPDGNLIASGSEDGTARIWDATTGKELLSLDASTDRGVNGLAFSPNGKLLATADADATIRIWDVSSGKEVSTLTGYSDRVQSVAFSLDGTRLAGTSNDHTIRLWDVSTGKELLQLLEDNSGEVYWVDFNSTGTQIATAARNGKQGWASVWDLETGQKLFELHNGNSDLTSAVFSPDDSIIATTGYDQTAKLWDAKTGDLIFTLYGHSEAVTSAAFSPDGKRIATSSWDRHVKIWDVATGQQLLELDGHTRDINCVSFNPDGTRIVTASVDQTVRVWNVAETYEYRTLVNGPKVEFIEGGELAYSPDGTRLVTANADPTPKVWDVKTGKLLFTLRGHTDIVTYATFNRDGSLIGTASNDGTAKIWDAATGRELLTLQGHKNFVFGFDFSPDGKYIATSSFDYTAQIWDAKTGKSLRTMIYRDWIFSVTFSPDGKRLAGGTRGAAIIWDVETGKQLFMVTDHHDMVDQVVFSPDGTRLATASLDGTAKVWDATNGKELFAMSSHSSSVFDIAYSHDGNYLATASSDKTARLWDAQTGQELLIINTPSGLTGVAFSPNDTQLAVAGRDGTTRIYLLRLENLIALAKSRLTRTWTLEECRKYLHADACPAE